MTTGYRVYRFVFFGTRTLLPGHQADRPILTQPHAEDVPSQSRASHGPSTQCKVRIRFSHLKFDLELWPAIGVTCPGFLHQSHLAVKSPASV